MEKKLFRGIVLPLEEIVFRRVVVCLLNNTLNSNWNLRYDLDLVENMAKGKAYITKMLPTLLTDRMMPLIRPMASEILNWHMYHENNFHDIRECFGLHSLKYLQWTSIGTIDYQKTMEKIIGLKIFDVENRYKLACLYCLEDYIPLLWEELSEESKKHFSKESYFDVDMQLRYYWVDIMKEDEYILPDIFLEREPNPSYYHEFAFKLAAMKGNKAATRYFFQNVCNEERESDLFSTIVDVLNELGPSSSNRIFSDFPKGNLSDVLCYLLSLMSPEQQMQILKTHPCDILTCFQDWPLQHLFLEVADIIWSFLPEENYVYLLTNMHKRIKTSDYYCPKLFQEFFLRSPGNFKKEFVNTECQFGYFFPEFFRMQDFETVEVIFRNIEAADRVRLVFGKRVFMLLCDSIFYNKWHVVKVCLQEAMLPEEDKQKLKKSFSKFIKKSHKRLGANEINRKRKSFCEFFDKSCNRTDEEKSEDETPTEVKKLCTEKKKNVLPRN
ncbi:uncharacterized protein LOC129956924 [Argiope bruennichi]|uniref:Uncharacterized protein n=1 Tax=Argiope bruennichi TaxID=94029 RepID=A0A8T0FGB8_ARGBR|nr:uncharacterized protein LOC129956924 [Argiope bruennichi]KAF8789445.1 hypothetical protein HNY73_007383 [Argiope bruennichi]